MPVRAVLLLCLLICACGQAAEPLTIAVLASPEGELEACGCTESARGGLDRMATLLGTLRARPGPSLLVLAGRIFVPRTQHFASVDDAQVRQKGEALARVLAGMTVDVLAPSAQDWLYGEARVRGLAKNAAASVVTAPRAQDDTGGLMRAVGRERIGLFALAGDAPARAAALRRKGATLVIAFVPEGAVLAPHAVPGVDVVIRADESAASATIVDGSVVVSSGRGGSTLSVLTLAAGRRAGLPWTLVDAGNSERENAVHAELLRADAIDPDPDLRRELDRTFATLSPSPPGLRTEAPEAAPYVGARTCAACHTAAYVWWTGTRHARALASLSARGRKRDHSCVGCHVTGFGEDGGYREESTELAAVGCESCHGPGQTHVENPRDPAFILSAPVREATCVACHDAEHSDRFVFSEKRALLITRGHGGR